ncbi:MAG TPA: VTT domain-containing protein [Acidimicrobiales bacterium]|nr:VTT domain-containing protein [Acidimicrobiales bacterium]
MAKGMRLERFRTPLLWLAAVRAVLGLVAVPLAPFLYKKHFAILVLLRPTKEVLLAAGFQIRRGDASPITVLAAAIPLCIFGVWLFFFLGRAFATEIQDGEGLPKFAERLLPTKRIKDLCAVLDKKGTRLVFLGRLATFPSSVLASAAGASEMPAKKFLPADLAGGLAGIGEVLFAGYVLGEAYKKAGPWLTGVGVIALLVMLVILGRTLSRTKG